MTSGSDASCYVTQRRVDLSVLWVTAGYVDLSNMIKTDGMANLSSDRVCRVAAGYAVLREELLEVARGVG